MLKPITRETANRLNCLIIGGAGIGKTSLIRTIPEGEKILVLSCEGGLLAVRDLVEAGEIEGFEVGSFADLKEAYQLLHSPDFKTRYQWIFIDSLTEISGKCLESVQAKYPSKTDSYNLWGEFSDNLTHIIKAFRDLTNYSVVFTCLPTIQVDDLKRRYVGADVAGKQLKERLPSYFDLVLYMISKEDENSNENRIFLTSPSDRYPAKDRSGKLLQIEQPNLASVKFKILGGI
ncbi:MAG: AAA family ATPase [Deltaproteobacteria bacterium]